MPGPGPVGGAGHASQWQKEQQQAAMKKREAAAAKNREHKKENVELMKKYDKNGNHKLEKEELVNLLTESKSSTEAGVPPTDEEVAWIIRVADKPKKPGEKADGCIDLHELEEAISCFGTLEDVREELQTALEKYLVAGDASNPRASLQCRQLPSDRLHEVLTDLNGGSEVAQHDEAKVLKWLPEEWQGMKVHNIPDKELLPAMALWYSDVRPAQSQCCVVQ